MLGAAFLLGIAAKLVQLPPLVGFLLAGFALNAAGWESTPLVETASDLGVTLLLFTIGLKLRVQTLLRPSVWAGATLHMGLVILLFGALLYGCADLLSVDLDVRTALLIAFALSFSSTVFAVKIFEAQGQSGALYARIAIGILIMQDLVAVVFLAASKGRMPSVWALLVLLLIPGRRLLKWLMERSGHGELLLLLGLVMAFQGYAFFEAVDLKGDLGALALGVLVADHPKAREMADSLLGFKDVFLVGFFLSIGLGGAPDVMDVAIAFALVALVPIKVALYFGLLTRFRLRTRTALMTSLGLANYSEFGLIVAMLGVKLGWLSTEWLSIIAVAVALTFVASSPLNARAHRIYDRLRGLLAPFETTRRLPEEDLIHAGSVEVVVFGMGRVGTGAYDALAEELGDRLLGVDNDAPTVLRHLDAGRRVIHGDPTDLDFWERLVHEGDIKVAMLALPNQASTLTALAEIRQRKPPEVVVTALANHDDHVEQLREHGAAVAFNVYANAGQGYADLIREATR